ncbi:hypothetical protein P3T31_004364 [Rhizobium sp. AN70]|nr:hypothetical protein [Rhizobium sp. AN70]
MQGGMTTGKWGIARSSVGGGYVLVGVAYRVGGCGLPPSALPGISPSRGEISRKRHRHFILRH